MRIWSLLSASQNSTPNFARPIGVAALAVAVLSGSAYGQVVQSVNFRYPAVFGSEQVVGTVTLAAPAASAVTVLLSSSNPNVSVPFSITIPANATSQTFTANAYVVTSRVTANITAQVGNSSASGSLLVDVMNWTAPFADAQNSGRSQVVGPLALSYWNLIATAPTGIGPNNTANLVALPGSRGVELGTSDAKPNASGNAYVNVSRNGWSSPVSIYEWYRLSTTYAAYNSPEGSDPPFGNPFVASNQLGSLVMNQREEVSLFSTQHVGPGAEQYRTFLGQPFSFQEYFSNFYSVVGNTLAHQSGGFVTSAWTYSDGGLPSFGVSLPVLGDGLAVGSVPAYIQSVPTPGLMQLAINSNDLAYYSFDTGYLTVDGGQTYVSIADPSSKPLVIGLSDEAYVTGVNGITSVSSSGATLWYASLGNMLSQPCVGPDDTIYASYADSSNQDWLVALDQADGSVKWKKAVNGYVGCVDAIGTSYVVGAHGVLSDYNSSGALVSSSTIDPNGIDDPIIASDGKLYLFGSNRTKLYTITPPQVANLSLSTSSLVGGKSATATLTMTEKAPAGGFVVQISTDSPGLLSIPSSVTVKGGATSVTFNVQTASNSSDYTARVNATYASSAWGAGIHVVGESIANLAITPIDVKGGLTTQGVVTLPSPAPSGGYLVNLSSGDRSVAEVPTSVTVPAGATSATFTIQTHEVVTAKTAVVTAADSVSSKSSTVAVRP